MFASHLQLLLVNVQNKEEVVAMYRIHKKSLLCTDVISMVGSESAKISETNTVACTCKVYMAVTE